MPRKSKLVRLVEQFYILVKASLVFWLNVLRGGVVYGWVPAYAQMTLYLEHPDAGAKYLRQHYPLTLAKQSLLSFVISLNLALLVLINRLTPALIKQAWFQILIVALVVTNLVFIAYLTLVVWCRREYQLNARQVYLAALSLLVKQPLLSVTLLVSVSALGLLGYLNLLLFFCLGPAAYGLLTNKLIAQQLKHRATLVTDLPLNEYR